MSDVKREIVFAESMNIDKRNADFAYLRKNVFKARTKGLYPAQDFTQRYPNDLLDTHSIEDILGSLEGTYDIKVIWSDGTNLNFNNLGSNADSNTQLAGVDYECGAFGEDGVMICVDNDHLYTVNHQNSNTVDQGVLPSGARPSVAGYDGLYYWWVSNNEIYRQAKTGGAAVVAFNNIGIEPRFIDFYGDQMVIFCEEAGSIVILFWDKSDTDLFDKRIIINNARLIAGGVVDGVLTLVRGIGNSSNPKEQDGEIVVGHYDGEKFARVNSIKAGDDAVAYVGPRSVGIGSEVMCFSVTDNDNDNAHNPDLFVNYVYKVDADGRIEVQYEPDVATDGDVRVVRIFQNYTVIAQNGNGAGNVPIIRYNRATDTDYGDFEEYTTTEYITNFLNNPYNEHQLEGVMVAFEKLFEQTDAGATPPTGEELDVYYRVSERDDFTLLMNVTVEKVKDYVNPDRDQSTEYASDTQGLPEQRYAVSVMPDGETPLPRFGEIQYKFVSKRGFSIIGAWYKYSYTSNNTFM